MQMGLLIRLSSMNIKVDKNHIKSHTRYKRNFYKAIKYIPTVLPGSELYLEKQNPSSRTQYEILSVEPRYMLQPKTSGPYKVLDSTVDMVTIREDGIQYSPNRPDYTLPKRE